MLERMFYKHLEEDEELYLVIHKYWFVGLKTLLLPASGLLASFVLLYNAPLRSVAILIALIDIALILWFLRNFLDYFLDAWIITNSAVIDVEWHGWFHRQSTRIDYSSIEGVSYEIIGVMGTLLRYGTVTIEKISSGATVSLDYVKNPKDVESSILACQEACVRSKNMKDSSIVKDIIAEIVAERMYLHEQEDEEEEYVENEEYDE